LRHAVTVGARRLAALLDNTQGRRLQSVRKLISYEIRTAWLKRPTVAPIGKRSKIIVYPGETNGPVAAKYNPPNRNQMRVWEQHLRPGDLFVDVGANIGIYTIYSLDLGARVIACEPDPHNYERLVENLHLNRFEAEALNVAVADKPGIFRFTKGLDSFNHLVFDGSDGIEVEATTVDVILGDRHATGVKIDVEGAERLVLVGAARALADRRIDMIQFEWAGHEIEPPDAELTSVPEMLRDAGYALHRPDAHGNLILLTGPVEARRGVSHRDLFAVSPNVR
jgi:FkbM family methyltransferase